MWWMLLLITLPLGTYGNECMYNTTSVANKLEKSLEYYEEQVYYEQKSIVMERIKRHTSVLECVPNHYGKHCIPCDCNKGPCRDGKFGSGECICPQEWFWSHVHKKCLQTPFGYDCQYNTSTGDIMECASCYQGRKGSTCQECTEQFSQIASLIERVSAQ